jgi:tetratricopeptide (TPR) repeat protein
MSILPDSGQIAAVALADMAMPRVFFELLHGRFTGTLEVPGSEEGQRSTVWFRGGMPLFTDWHDDSDVLGRVLIDGGVVTREEVEQALRERKAGELLGAKLKGLGRIGEASLREGLREQCFRKLVHLFGLRGGDVRATAVDHAVGVDDELAEVNVLELILAGVTAHYDEIRVTLEMREDAHGPVKATSTLARYAGYFRFDQADRPVLEALSGGTQLNRLESLPGVDRKRAVQIIYTLWACNMLDAGTAEAARGAADQPSSISPPMQEYTEAIRRRKSIDDHAKRSAAAADGVDEAATAKGEAERALEAGKFALAHEAFRRAHALVPDDPEVEAGLAWCRYQLSSQEPDDARVALVALEKVVSSRSDIARPQYYMGVVLEALGENEAARDAYATARTLDPGIQEAVRRGRALRAAGMDQTGAGGTHPLWSGHMPVLLIGGAIFLVGLIVANFVIGLDW